MSTLRSGGADLSSDRIFNVNSRTITPPADGFVVAIASAQFDITHRSDRGDTSVTMAVATDFDLLPFSNRARYEVEASVGTDLSLSQSLTTHDVFPVTAGTPTTIFLNVRASGEEPGQGLGTNVRSQLTLFFVPTAYGTVEREPGPALPGAGVDAEAAPLTPGEIAAEREASIAANFARMEAEMAEMRAEIEALRAERGNNAPRGGSGE